MQKQSSLKAEFEALKQQHEFTVMQLSDLKQNYEKIKKLNTTILQNMMKEPCDFYNEIKVIIDGNLYSQKIVDLENQLENVRNKISDEVERRVQEFTKNNINKNAQHDCQNCQKCKNLWGKCTNCLKLKQIIQQKSEKIDKLRLQIQQKNTQIEIIQSKKQNQKYQRLSQLQQTKKMLQQSVNQLQQMLSQQQLNNRKINQSWEAEYHNLNQNYQAVLAELQNYRRYYQQQQNQDRQRERQNQFVQNKNKKNSMVKQIQNILGQLGNKKPMNNNINVNNGSQTPRMSKFNSGSSRLITQDSDFSNFSIKDAINRPNQFTFY